MTSAAKVERVAPEGVVYIKWQDAMGGAGWNVAEDPTIDIVTVETLGFLVKETETVYTVSCARFNKLTDENTQVFGPFICIPKSWTLEVHSL